MNPDLGETGEFYSADSAGPLQNDFKEFCLEVFREEMEDASTLDLHYTLLRPETYGIEAEDVSLGTYDLVEMIENHDEIRDLKSRLLEYDREELTSEQRVTYDALLETLNTSLMAEGLELYEQPLAPTIGVQAQLPILLAEYSFHSVKDVEDYLELVSQMDHYYKEILEFENQKADAGLAPSDASIDAIIASSECYLVDPENNFLTETFRGRLAELEETVPLTEDQKADFTARHIAAIREHFVPAYEALIQGMTALKGRGINDGGLAGLKDGKTYYEYLIKSGPASSYSVPELKAALTERMEQDLYELNLLYSTYPDLDDRITNAAFSLTDPQTILEDLKTKITTDFPVLPDCKYEIRYVPTALEDSLSPAFYLTAPLDNTDQNVIYINRGYSDASDSLYTTLSHEGFPGHLYQTVYNRSHAESPLRSILSCSGANEGWATYVEHYAHTLDNGLPEGVGEYHALLRSYSLCVHGLLDIGINYEGWDQAAAKEFISSCFTVDDATVAELWQVMIDNPTNYLEYCGGFVEILDMRNEAELALGEQFSAMEFHQFLLDIGPVPFSVIRRHFSDWLDSQISSLNPESAPDNIAA